VYAPVVSALAADVHDSTEAGLAESLYAPVVSALAADVHDSTEAGLAESLYAPVVSALAAVVPDSTEADLGLVALVSRIAPATEARPANCQRIQAKTH
jgi:hypothetical protein